MSRKPIGKIGPLRISINQGVATKSLETVNFSENKRDNEDKILSIFKTTAESHGFVLQKIEANPENHFDYTLFLSGGQVFLDLMEIIYCDNSNQNRNPYNMGSTLINNKDYAEQIVGNILKKSRKYQNKGSTPIHLLTYVTNWSFQLSDNVITLCQHYLRNGSHIFENIFFLTILDDKSGALRVLFPSNEIRDSNIEELEDQSFLCVDLSKAYLVK